MGKSDSNIDLSELLGMTQDSSAGRGAQLDVRYLFNLVLRFRWVLIVPFCLAMLAGIYLALTLPRMYRSAATILVEPQSVPEKYVHATVPVDIDARIASLAQQIMSRSNLVDLIERFKLFSGPSSKEQLADDKLEAMRKHVRVKLVEEDLGRDKRVPNNASAFQISYEDTDPEKVFQVVNAMSNYVIDQNLKMRELHAVGTSDFLQDELTKMRKRLEEVEAALENYRRAHMGELPEQLQSNLTILERLQQQMSEKNQSLRDEKNRLLIVENQLRFAQQQSAPPPVAVAAAAPGGEVKSLEGLKQLLADYESKYTANHPDVVQLKKKIEKLEAELAEAKPSAPAPQPARPAAASGTRPLLEAELLGQQQGLLRNIQAIETELVGLRAQIEHYQKRVEETPKREQELLSLKRDYENIKGTYNSILARKLEADIALNMEKKQKGEQFRILDPPQISRKPVSPNLRVIFLACILAGLGIGGGIVFLYEFFDGSVKKPDAFQARLSLPVLAVIPSIERLGPARSRIWGWLNTAASACAALASAGLLAALAAVTVLDLPQAGEMIRGILGRSG
jgi:polysaccharide chain length determinant protein (PEP-CTERM system associated)